MLSFTRATFQARHYYALSLRPHTPRPPESCAGAPVPVAYPLGGLAFCGGVCTMVAAGQMNRQHRKG